MRLDDGREIEIGPAESSELHLAALAGERELAHQLRRLGYPELGDALQDAFRLPSAILRELDRRWTEGS